MPGETVSQRKDASNLTERQRRFVLEYAASGAGAKSARNAGYSLKSAHEIASELLKKPHVQAEIARLRRAVNESAYERLKSKQLDAADALYQTMKAAQAEGKHAIVVDACKEILKDVLSTKSQVSLEEIKPLPREELLKQRDSLVARLNLLLQQVMKPSEAHLGNRTEQALASTISDGRAQEGTLENHGVSGREESKETGIVGGGVPHPSDGTSLGRDKSTPPDFLEKNPLGAKS